MKFQSGDFRVIARICSRHRVPLIGWGTGTSLEGHVNAPAGGISVDMSRMNEILDVHHGAAAEEIEQADNYVEAVLDAALAGEPVASINHVESRYLVWLEDAERAETCAEKLERVFGIRWVSPAVAVPQRGGLVGVARSHFFPR